MSTTPSHLNLPGFPSSALRLEGAKPAVNEGIFSRVLAHWPFCRMCPGSNAGFRPGGRLAVPPKSKSSFFNGLGEHLLFKKNCVSECLLERAHAIEIPLSNEVSIPIISAALSTAVDIDADNCSGLVAGNARIWPHGPFGKASIVDRSDAAPLSGQFRLC